MRATTLYALALSLLALPTATRAADKAVLIVQSARSTLHVSACAPASVNVSGSAWQLTEQDAERKPIPVDVLPAIAADGSIDRRVHDLIVSILPSTASSAPRRFRLEGSSKRTPAAFRFADIDDKSLGLWEGERPVLAYNHGVMSKPGVPADRNRSSYVHPIYGLDGEVITDDFPKDHYHHRGMFWAWPHVRIGGKEYNLWMITNIRHVFERWMLQHAGGAAAVLGVENGWYIGERKVVQERVWLHVYPACSEGRMIDVSLTWIATDEPVTLWGAEGKSYGGFNLRFGPRKETVITTPSGRQPERLNLTRLPWADLTGRFAGAPGPSGAAVFVDPSHPDYPPTWITRPYGFLGVGWPGIKPATLQPNKPVRCRYRVWVHRGLVDVPMLERVYDAYKLRGKVTWEAHAE